MNTSATLAHLESRLAHVYYDLNVEANALRNGYGSVSVFDYLNAKHRRIRLAVDALQTRRNKQLGIHG